MDRINSVIGVIKKEEEGSLDAEIEEKIKQRTEARKAKNFQLADEIRDQLKNKCLLGTGQFHTRYAVFRSQAASKRGEEAHFQSTSCPGENASQCNIHT